MVSEAPGLSRLLSACEIRLQERCWLAWESLVGGGEKESLGPIHRAEGGREVSWLTLGYLAWVVPRWCSGNGDQMVKLESEWLEY